MGQQFLGPGVLVLKVICLRGTKGRLAIIGTTLEDCLVVPGGLGIGHSIERLVTHHGMVHGTGAEQAAGREQEWGPFRLHVRSIWGS